MTNIVPATTDSIERAAQILRAGGLVAFPTETVYGLGANALDPVAVEKIYIAKGRPAVNPLIVHLSSFEELHSVASVAQDSPIESHLARIRHLWPGPLSVVLPRAGGIPDRTTAGLPSVAVRIPAHPVAREIIARAGVPIAAPSANRSSYISPTTAHHVAAGLNDAIDLIIDGGPCAVGVESTILSLIHPRPTVLRHGGVTLESLRAILGAVDDSGSSGEHSDAPLSPGLLRQHYSPRTRLVFCGELSPQDYPARTVVVTFGPAAATASPSPIVVRALSERGDLEEAARTLFATLRELDDGSFDLIVVEPCPRIGLGRAIMDRLSRAAAQRE